MTIGPEMTLSALRQAYSHGLTPRILMETLRQRHEDRRDPAIFIHFLSEGELEPYLRRLETAEPEERSRWPLYGIPFAIKDNIDLAGIPTTAGCREFAYTPTTSNPVVGRLVALGAIPIGKTNLDQFATGLVGVRSPYGIPGNPFDARFIPGGSSSGSAVATASGLCSFSLGTDTAGSGRVPAAFNNLVGIKPSRGLLSTRGVVPACRSLDCLSLFTANVRDGGELLELCAFYDPEDPYSSEKELPRLRPPIHPLIGVPRPEECPFFGNTAYERLFAQAVQRFQSLGARVVACDFTPFREAAELLYQGPWVAERTAAIGDFLRTRSEALHPVTRRIIAEGASKTAVETFQAMDRLKTLTRRVQTLFQDLDFLLTPTAGTIYRIDEVLADPITLNANLGYYTNFINLLDLAAIALPAGFTSEGLPFGITLAARAWGDLALAEYGGRFLGEASVPEDLLPIAVCGAHMRGLPLSSQLLELGGRFVREDRTAPEYRLFAFQDRGLEKPGLLRVLEGGASIALEIWHLPSTAWGRFMDRIPSPLGLGRIRLASENEVTGFVLESWAQGIGREITSFGGWRAYIRR